jgi:hypothetical protein
MIIDGASRDDAKAAGFLAFVSQPELPGVPAATRACLRCDGVMPAPRRAGRPERFCSDACRHAQAVEQRAAYVAAHGTVKASGSACWTCGGAFPIGSRQAGRVPRYCSRTCRQAGRRALAAGYRARQRRIQPKAGGG